MSTGPKRKRVVFLYEETMSNSTHTDRSTHTIRPTISTLQASLAAVVLASGVASAPAFADPPDPLDHVNLGIGAFLVHPDANLSINSQYGSANSGDITSHSVTVPRAQANFLLGDSQGISLDYYGFYRRYSDSLNQNVTAGGSSVNLDANATANVGIDVADASYKWWFGGNSDVFGIGVGAAYYRVHLGTNGTATTNLDGGESASGSGTYSADTFAPLVQAGWRHAFDKNTRMYLDVSGVEKHNGNLSGHIYNASLGAECFFAKNIGVGAEYTATRVRLDDKSDGANLNMNLNGPSVFLRARF